jgi:hypothetical protein
MRIITFRPGLVCTKMKAMRRVLFLIALVLLIGIYISGPFFEAVDHWDNFPQSGNDIILTLVMAATFFALLLCATIRLVHFISSMARAANENTVLASLPNSCSPVSALSILSPPKLLAGTLRI